MGLIASALADGVSIERGADTEDDDAAYLQAAIEARRAIIGVVGASDGSGAVRGVNVYDGDIYAFRDNAAATECLMWKATTLGWIQQSLGNRVSFTSGTLEFLEGETLNQSGPTATILRVVLQTGAWGTNDAAGYLIIGTVANGPYSSGVATSSSGSATLSGAETANTLLPGGKFEFENYNFFGTTGTFRMYGVDGVNPAFEWDGSVFVPIITGNTNDSPSHLAIHKYHLFLTFEKGSLQHSGTGDPYKWSGGGAAEIGTGDFLIGLKVEVGQVLAILCRNRTFMLYGNDSTDWDLKTISDESGGIEWTMQRIGDTKYLDDRGFTRLTAVQEYGDFQSSVFSQSIEPLVDAKKSVVSCSLIVKSKSQYRIFFTDGTGITATIDNNKIKGFTQFEYFDSDFTAIVINCTANGEDSNGNEVMYVGAGNGYVYQMDKGTSVDGDPVSAFIRLSFSHMRSPETIKKFLKCIFEATATDQVELKFTPDYDYSDRSGNTQDLTMTAGGGFFDIDKFDEFLWSEAVVANPEAYLEGSGKNIGLLVYNEGTYEAPFTLHGATLDYEFRRRVR